MPGLRMTLFSVVQAVLFGLVLFVVSSSRPVGAEKAYPSLEVADVFSDNMVLQRDRPVPVWGWTQPGETVTVTFAGKKTSAVADSEGRWQAVLEPLPAGGPYEMTLEGPERIVLKNILVGEVWLASGQSNMEWPLSWSENAEQAVAQANWPEIRLLKIPHQSSPEPRTFVETSGWVECSPSMVGNFSAIAYYFGRHLHRELGVPIGLIDNSWGGSSMEAWTPLDVLQATPAFDDAIAQYHDWATQIKDLNLREEYKKAFDLWKEQTGGEPAHRDPGRQPFTADWAKTDFADGDWAVAQLPGAWETWLPLTDGVVWFRKTVDFPSRWQGKDLSLHLGPIDDLDTCFLNGVEVGRTGLETPNAWLTHRIYSIPAGRVRSGSNTLAVRVMDTGGGGGFGGPAEALFVCPADSPQDKIPLAGEWKYKIAVRLQQKPDLAGQNDQQIPAALYNAMLHPLIPYAIRGAIWYQGESNCARADRYLELSKRMIGSWRDRWGEGDFYFLLAQLTAFDVDWKGWCEVREAQTQTLSLPNTAMAVTVDIGSATDIHPRNKLDVGYRLALGALAQAYGKDIVYSGPLYRSMEKKEGQIVLSFDHTGSGLVAKGGGELKGFTLAGADRVFHPAQAKIEGERIVVSSADVPEPVAVRYAWANYPLEANLYNREGLPASPFRTDDFKE